MTSRSELTAEMLFVAMRLLVEADPAEAASGVRYRELHRRLFETNPDLEARWREIAGDSWDDDSYTELQFASIGLVKAGLVCKARRRWFVTGRGRYALDACPDKVSFYAELGRAYRYWEEYRNPLQGAVAMVEALPEGRWASLADVASEANVEETALLGLLLGTRPDGWHRLLSDDGTPPREAHLTEEEREEWLGLLSEDGVLAFDGKADGLRRTPARETVVIPVVVDPAARRAWLVRASNLRGGDLITGLWLPEGVCSLAASRLRDLPSGAPAERVRDAVREDYSGTGAQERERLTGEYHAFLSRMRENDIVVTNEGSAVYLGVITGEPSFAGSVEHRANLQRPVEWRNAEEPLDYDELPADFAALVSNPDADLVELTPLVPELDKLLGEPGPVIDIEVRLPDVTGKLAEELLVKQEWLQECVELLRERPQLIFYGPPGTGKTYLARHLARHLTSGRPENVQLVQFHPAYSYEDFFEGYRPRKGEDGTVSLDLVRGPFRRLVSAALAHPGRPYVLIIDEINRGNLAKIFGELYFLLEYRDQPINLLYAPEDDKGFTLPKNVFIIGTMNTADRSIALVDAAMRRRFWFTELHPDEPPTDGMLAQWLKNEGLPDEPARLLAELNSRIDDRDFRIGPSYLMREGVDDDVMLERIWRTQIIPLLEEHHYGDGTDVKARYGLDALRNRLR
ncbi:McrB family protein [Actinomadura violacea]|uniref:AAA family ATPase n=1 Tax=Actinomadura violacea TaxID=2819934 RepID=A0ABS3RKL5_9ACTN|nr:AAA family ATPase [Actinomadura violacea]MBO2457273.1 AAA family ATPase [Actinomadura violacea]